MPFRGVLLRVALASLAVAAVVGASAILVADQDIVWRIVRTAVATAVATGLLFGTSFLIDKPASRATGLFGSLLIVVAFLLTIASIWDLPELLLSNGSTRWRMPVTTFVFCLVSLPAVVFVRWLSVPQARLASIVGLAGCAMVFSLSALSIWFRTAPSSELGESAGVTSLFALAVVAMLIIAGPSAWQWARYAAVAAGTAAWLMALYAIWWNLHEGSLVFTGLCCVVGVGAYINLTLLPALAGWQRWVRFAAIVSAVVAGGAVFAADAGGNLDSDEILPRLAGSASFIAGCCALALLIFWRLNRRVAQVPVISQIDRLTLVCPGCHTRQTVSTGASQCPACNLRFDIQIHEPRCPQCDYLLYMLKSDRCPECGTPVAVNQTRRPETCSPDTSP